MKLKKFIKTFISIIIISIIIILTINFYVILSTKNQIINKENITDLKDIDCILILGAGVWNNEPSPMLEDRLLKGIELYENNISPKIIMSGDHREENYDEVNTMKRYAIKKEIPSENIFMDHAGLSTYDSIYRAKEIFQAKKIIIVTQEYHLYRALYIANSLDLEAYGVSTDKKIYNNQIKKEIRELLARNKDFVKSILKPEPTYLGKSIPVNGNGDITNDKEQEWN